MTRVRSPNYPALSLPDAIDRVRAVYGAQQTTPEPRDVVVKHMGYGSVNGRALKTLSALIKYGLLETSDGDGLKVSRRALTILHPDPENPLEKNEALLAAARSPALYQGIFDRWDGKPSQDSLNAYLIRNGFNANAVEVVARAFYETYSLVSDIEDSYDSAIDEPEEEGGDEMQEQQSEAKAGARIEQSGAQSPMPDPVLNSTKPKFDFESVEILTKIDNRDDLEQLLERLESIKNMLPSKAQH